MNKKLNFYNTKLKTVDDILDICEDLHNESNMEENITNKIEELRILKIISENTKKEAIEGLNQKDEILDSAKMSITQNIGEKICFKKL